MMSLQDAGLRRVIRVMMIGLVLMTPSFVYGFSQDGFHDGMTLSEVEKEAERQGYGLGPGFGTSDPPDHPGWQTYPADRVEERFFDFCQGRLAGYHRLLPNMTEAILRIDDYTKVYGVGEYKSVVFMPDLKRKFRTLSHREILEGLLKLTWKIGNEYGGVEITTSEPVNFNKPTRPLYRDLMDIESHLTLNYEQRSIYALLPSNRRSMIFWLTRKSCD